MPAIVIGELFYGAYRTTADKNQIARVEAFLDASAIIGIDSETARLYGRIKSDLRPRGRMIPENDIWIAAIALQHDLTLVARDRHFAEVENLKRIEW